MQIDNISRSKSIYNLLKTDLDVSSLRGKVISNNIANINTPNFKKSYVTFEETLQDNLNSENSLKLKTSDEKHMQTNNTGGYGDYQVVKDDSTSMREDGNNVDVDQEMVNQASNALMYNALVTQINGEFSMRRSVIDGK